MNISIRRDNDPFKKYWWVLLLAFGGVGAWLCSPLLESSGAVGAVREQGLKSGEQSLDGLGNPSGAPGGPMGLSMEGSYRKRKTDGPISSSLTLPPEANTPEAPAGKPSAASGSASLASALKEVSRKTDPSGWGGAKVQKAFNAPRANFSGLSGLGSSSGGGSGASLGAFGSAVAKTGYATTRGLGGGSELAAAGDGRTMRALKSASGPAGGAPSLGAVDLAAAQSARTFDGSRGAGTIAGGGAAESGGLIANLDSIPQNLKANDPKLQEFKFEPPPSKVVEDDLSKEEAKKKMLMMIATMAVGGVVGGTAGTMIMMMGPMLSEMAVSGGKN